jgi:hypothetical protein
MTKIAVTIPEEQMRALERARRQQRLPRSRVIQNALALYFAQSGLAEQIRAYEDGYRRKPERGREFDAYAHAAAEVLGTEEWE